MKPPLLLEVCDESHVGSSRRQAVALAQAAGMDETTAGTVAIVVTELARNLVRFATGGMLAVQWISVQEGEGVEVLSIDSGPGMASVADCMRDGFSTNGTPGTGLGAVRRLSGEFDIHSMPAKGTIVLSRVFLRSVESRKVSGFGWGAVCRPIRGESSCGDAWRVLRGANFVSLLVVDGLGHGPDAAKAAAAVTDAFEGSGDRSPEDILAAAHERAGGTRGAAASIARVDLESGRIRFAGVGNVAGCVAGGETSKGMFTHNGILGVQVRKIQGFDYDWPAGGILVLHSDGLQTRWSMADYPGLSRRHPSVVAAVLARDYSRERDDMTVLVARREAA
jgi:anti-sigma regulatory factor (Ser/Thr protein kinase)